MTAGQGARLSRRRPGAARVSAAQAGHSIGIRELRQHASVYVDLVEKGQTVDITNRGRLVARLVPARDVESPLERLIAAGIIQPAEDPGSLLDIEPAPPVPEGPADRLGDLAEDARGGKVLIYLDSSALVKLAVAERESAGLLSWLAEQPNLVQVSSSVIRVEVPRAVWRAEPSALPESYLVIRRTAEIELTGEVLGQAARTRPVTLGALDAIHLASALVLRRELTSFVSYDTRLLAAARDAGLPTASPA